MQKLTNEFKIEFTKGDTYALAIKFKNITEDLRLAYFSVKDNPDDAPLIQKSLGAGIDKIDDRGYKNEKTYKFQLQPADTVNLEANVQYLYDIQVTIGSVVKTVLHGIFVLRNTITGTTAVTTANIEVEVDDEVETEMLDTVPATNGIEYEQDPVALAKIGNLDSLATTNKETVVQAVNEVKNGVNTNADKISKIENGTNKMPYAKDVTDKINGKALSEIFEEDGKTVKKATKATTADNVKNINNNPLTDIFESDGKTVKVASLLSCKVAEETFNEPNDTNIQYKLTQTGLYLISVVKRLNNIDSVWFGVVFVADLNMAVDGVKSSSDLSLSYSKTSQCIEFKALSTQATYAKPISYKIYRLCEA